MIRPALAATLLATLAALCACGHETSSATTAGAPSGRSGQDVSAAPVRNRFQLLYDESAVVFRRAGEEHEGPAPRDAGDANRLLGLDATSPVRFADVQDLGGDHGRFCLVSDDATYVALTVGRTVTVLFGDGSCTYAEDDAAVVGDVFGDSWTRGAELMGHRSVSGLFANGPGAGGDGTALPQSSLEASPQQSNPASAQQQGEADPQLLGEVRSLAFSIDGYALTEGHYPRVGPADLVRTVASGSTFRLGRHTHVHSYRATTTGYAMCVADDGSWVRWETTRRGGDVSSSAMSSGTWSSRTELDRMCTTPATP